MEGHQIEGLMHRLDCLEQENRFWRRVSAVILVVVGCIALMGQTHAGPRVIEAERLVIKDKDGATRVVVGRPEVGFETASPLDGWYGVWLHSPSGNVARFVDSEGGLGSQLELFGKDTPSFAILKVSDEQAYLSLEATAQTKESMKVERNKWADKLNASKTAEEKERLIASRPTVPVANTYLVASPERGSAIGAVPRNSPTLGVMHTPPSIDFDTGVEFVVRGGRPTLRLADERGTSAVLGHTVLERKAKGSVEQLPASSLVLLDENRHVLWRAP
jgi:hypothetical protein